MEKNLDMGGGLSKMLKVGGLKNYDQPKSLITWAIIGEFDNFGQILAFQRNFGLIYGLLCAYSDLF